MADAATCKHPNLILVELPSGQMAYCCRDPGYLLDPDPGCGLFFRADLVPVEITVKRGRHPKGPTES